MIRIPLCDGWMVRRLDHQEWIPAEVPGSVFSALWKAGKIPDPYYRENERIVREASFYDYQYSLSFSVPEEVLEEWVVELVFEGVDTLGEVFLNGNPSGEP